MTKASDGRAKGQAPLMEYIVFLFMTVLIIAVLLFMVFGFQFLTQGSGVAAESEKQSLFLMQSMLINDITRATRYQSLSVLDDSKLTALSIMDCADFETAFGAGTWAEVTLYMEKPDCGDSLGGNDWSDCMQEVQDIEEMQATPCDEHTYPDCGTWTFCAGSKEARMVYRTVPVNIYRKMENRLSIGVLNVGVATGVQEG